MSYSHNEEFTYAFLPYTTTKSPLTLDLDHIQNEIDIGA